MKKIMLLALLALLIAALISPASAAVKYKMIDMGVPSGFNEAFIVDINDLGQIVGNIAFMINDLAYSKYAVFIGVPGKGMTNLNRQLKKDLDSARGINNWGDVICTATLFNNGDLTHSYLWNADIGLLDLQGATRTGSSIAQAINDNRQVVGNYVEQLPTSPIDLFLWQPNTGMTVYPGVNTFEVSINNSGLVSCGTPYLWSPDGGIELNSPANLNGIVKTLGVNNRDEVVGTVNFTGGMSLVIWDSEGNPIDLTEELELPRYYIPQDINDAGQIVGCYDRSVPSNSRYKAFVCDRINGAVELPTLSDGSSCATAINSAGWIAGGSIDNKGKRHAVVWIPDDGRDVTLPTVSITSPTKSATYKTTKPTINISGTASDNIGIVSAIWRNDRGGSGECTGTTNWSVSNIFLQPGLNVISVLVSDAAGNKALDTLSVTYTPVPSVIITADDTTLTEGESTTIRWNSTLATSVVSSNFGAKTLSGTLVVTPAKNTAYQITVKSADGKKVSGSVSVKVLPIVPKITLTADKASIFSGESTTIRWTSENVTKVISSSFGATAVNGTATVHPTKTTSYTITVADSKGRKVSALTSVKVVPRVPKVTLTADATTITKGQSTTIHWSSENATTLVSSSFGAKALSGSLVVTPTANTNYTITVADSAGTKVNALVTVIVLSPTPKLTITASPITIKLGQSSTITWTSNMAQSIVSSSFGATTLNGSKVVSPTRTTLYTMIMKTTTGATMSAAATVVVVK